MAVYEELPVPSYNVGDTYYDDELMASATGRETQWGITIAPNQDDIPLGTVMARSTVDKMYYPYASGGANGLGTPRGILRRPAGALPRAQFGNLVVSGFVKLSKVHGLDAGAITALGAVVDTANNTVRL